MVTLVSGQAMSWHWAPTVLAKVPTETMPVPQLLRPITQKRVTVQKKLFLIIFLKSDQKLIGAKKSSKIFFHIAYFFWPLGKNLRRDFKLDINPV